jgi:hypothetical protein
MATPELTLFSHESLAWSGARAPDHTICCGWPGAAGCSRGPARASTTPSQATREARLPVRPQGARQNPPAHRLHAHRQRTAGTARILTDPRRLHTAQERGGHSTASLRGRPQHTPMRGKRGATRPLSTECERPSESRVRACSGRGAGVSRRAIEHSSLRHPWHSSSAVATAPLLCRAALEPRRIPPRLKGHEHTTGAVCGPKGRPTCSCAVETRATTPSQRLEGRI